MADAKDTKSTVAARSQVKQFTKIQKQLRDVSDDLLLGNLHTIDGGNGKCDDDDDEEEDSTSSEEPKRKRRDVVEAELCDAIAYGFRSLGKTTYGASLAVPKFGLLNLDGKQLTDRPEDLYAQATPSPYGDLNTCTTVLDETVRKAREIEGKRLTWTKDGQLFIRHLEHHLKYVFGMCSIVPHKLNIYPVGGHFKPHQDTPRPGVLASLVIALPFARRGGKLTVEKVPGVSFDDDDEADGRSITAMAFYSDCKHWVDTVTEGYRVTVSCFIQKHSYVCPFDMSHKCDRFYVHECTLKTSDAHKNSDAVYSDRCRRIETVAKCLDDWFGENKRGQSKMTDSVSYEFDNCIKRIYGWDAPGAHYIEANHPTRPQLTPAGDDAFSKFWELAKQYLTEGYKPEFGILLSGHYSRDELDISAWKSGDQKLMKTITDTFSFEIVPVVVNERKEEGDRETTQVYRMTANDWRVEVESKEGSIMPLPESAPNMTFYKIEYASRITVRKEEVDGAEFTGNSSRESTMNNLYFHVAVIISLKDKKPLKKQRNDTAAAAE